MFNILAMPSSLKKPIGDPDVLQRRLHNSSAKYDAVRPTVNTGGNVIRLAEALSQRPPKDEPFKRMKCTSLQRLITEKSPEVRVVLLDVRPQDEYHSCHIDTAISYPSTMLSRSVNPFIPQVYSRVARCTSLSVRYCIFRRFCFALRGGFEPCVCGGWSLQEETVYIDCPKPSGESIVGR